MSIWYLDTVSPSLPTDGGFQGQFGNVSQGLRTWEHGNAPHYTLSPSWPSRMPQNFLPQGNGGFQPNKPFISQGKPSLPARGRKY